MQAHLHIDDLFTDLADGKMLMKLLEIISGENLGRPNKGVLRVQKIENINRSLHFLSTKVGSFSTLFMLIDKARPFLFVGLRYTKWNFQIGGRKKKDGEINCYVP